MKVSDIIAAKRDCKALDRITIVRLIESYTLGETDDTEMTGFARAVFDNGMTPDETCYLTEAMLASGEKLDFSADGNPVVDKHSTGGIGDKVSLVLAPLLACMDRRVPMLSGRSLGFTGGTLDKLESIPGFRTMLTLDEIVRLTDETGCVICGATEKIAPADRKLYALRDRTGTVGSVPLITASILSKKLAESPDGLIFDVKTGRGALMKSITDARALAQSLVDTARLLGVPSRAIISDMSQPLGSSIGNGLEVREAIAAMSGQDIPGLTSLTLRLAREALAITGTAIEESELARLLSSGAVMSKFKEMINAQGGRLEDLPTIETVDVIAHSSGFVVGMDGVALGSLVNEMAGRREEGPVDHEVGILVQKRIGDEVREGELLASVAHGSPKGYIDKVVAAIEIGSATSGQPPLVHEIVE
jgi:pyrimidine-nucleoside phosphorylase